MSAHKPSRVVSTLRRLPTQEDPPVRETVAPIRSPGDDGDLSVTVQGSETELVLVVAGDIDAGSHHRFRDALSTGLTRSRRLIVDLDAVDFVDPTGLNGIVWAGHQASQHDRQLALRGAPPQVRRLFQLTGLEQLMQPDARPPRDPQDPSESLGASCSARS
jgi:anti-anti-sigma factor